MRQISTLKAVTLMTLMFLLAFSVYLTPSAIADQCIQKTKSILYSQLSNTKYSCEVDGKKLMIGDFRRTPAPEGIYKKMQDGMECFIGKGGYILYCKR